VSGAGGSSDGAGTAIVEVDGSSAAVTRTTATPTSPAGVAIASSKIWFGDAYGGKVYSIDKSTFAVAAAGIPLQCPTTGTYSTTNDVAVIGGDLYAICSNEAGGVLNRLDSSTGASKGTAEIGPVGVELTQTGDGRIAVVSGADTKLRLVTVTASGMTGQAGYTFVGVKWAQ